MCDACGISFINFNAQQTRAFAYNASGSNIPTTDQLGRTGLMVVIYNDTFRLARAYDDNMNIGGWNSTSDIYSVGMYYNIDIYGASYT